MDSTLVGRTGPKQVVRGKRAVCSSSHPIVTGVMLQVMRDGGNAVDAAVAGCLVQAAVEPHMTNHAGSVMFLLWEAKTGKAIQLNSRGVLVPGLPLFKPMPAGQGIFSQPGAQPVACIPGFMPGLGAMHERFGSKPWAGLCAPAIRWADEGHPVSSFEYGVLTEELTFLTYFPSGRELFTPNGFLPEVGERFRNPKLAQTLRRLSQEGPEYFTQGDWARQFVAEGNRLGWPVKLEHMTVIPPEWEEPFRYRHGDHEILQLRPPQRVGVYTATVLGVLRHLGIRELGHYTESPQTLYYWAHVLRRAEWELGLLNDPKVFGVPEEAWLSDDYLKRVAQVLAGSLPKIDLTQHVRLISGNPAMAAAGLPTSGDDASAGPRPPEGSCELSIVDPDGNWVQMMNTLQSGGIPGVVVDGVPMVGSHMIPSMASGISGWLVGGGRLRSGIGNTIVLKDRRPCLSLGTPGNVIWTVPQVLSNVLDYDIDPYEACVLPRMSPLRDDYVLQVESRIPTAVMEGLARMGLLVRPLPTYDYHMGSFQMSWRDARTGLLCSSADPRRAGKADGLE